MEKQRFLQTDFWAAFKANHGWKALSFFIDAEGQLLPDAVCDYKNRQDKNSSRLTNGSSHAQIVSSISFVPATNGRSGENETEKEEKDSTLVFVDKTMQVENDSSSIQKTVFRLSVLVRSFSVKVRKFSIAYIPMAPERGAGEDASAYRLRLQSLADALKPYLPRNTICVRFDPPVDFATCEERDTFAVALASASGKSSGALFRAPVAVQPPDTVLLPLAPGEEELLASMKSKWRYNIRLAEKKGVSVRAYHASDSGFPEAFEHFYELFETTSKRDGVSFHAKSYYRDLLERGCPDAGEPDKPVITLYLAQHEQDYLAGIITLCCAREAVYLYGASGNVKRNYMPAYLLQWTAIRDAKQAGVPVYDFYGMPPTDDPGHPMHGLYLFKTGFGGNIVHRPGSFDVPLRRHGYRAYIAAEQVRAWWHRKVLKKIKGR